MFPLDSSPRHPVLTSNSQAVIHEIAIQYPCHQHTLARPPRRASARSFFAQTMNTTGAALLTQAQVETSPISPRPSASLCVLRASAVSLFP